MGSETEQSAMTNRVEPRETGSARFFYAEFYSDFQNLGERLFSGEKERRIDFNAYEMDEKALYKSINEEIFN